MASEVFIPLTVGGGVRELMDIRNLLNAGADKVAINSAAIQRPEFVAEASDRFGSQCIVVAIDAKRKSDRSGWEVYTHGGRTPTGRDAIAWAKEVFERGAGEILLTSMDADGTRAGYDIELTAAISAAIPANVKAEAAAVAAAHGMSLAALRRELLARVAARDAETLAWLDEARR